MGTVLRLPTYTYYDTNTIQKPSSVSFIMDDTLLAKMTEWYAHYGESGEVFEWTGDDIQNIPYLVNNALGFPLLSKKSGEVFLAIPVIENYDNALAPWITDVLTKLYVPYQLHTGMTDDQPSKMIRASNGKTITGQPSFISGRTAYYVTRANLTAYIDDGRPSITIPTSNKTDYSFKFMILPEDLFSGDGFNTIYTSTGEHGIDRTLSIRIVLESTIVGNNAKITRVAVYVNATRQYFTLANAFSNVDPTGADRTEFDNDNPYGEGGSATVGGGDGKYGDIDAVDGTAVPSLPSLSAVDTGFISLYNPTNANLKSLYQFLWSNQFDLNTFKKLYADPMQCIISLGITPCLPDASGATNIMFGNVDSGVNATELSTQFAQVDCGSVDIDKYVGSFLDYSPFVKINLFLPYIGFVHLGTDDIMGGSINVTYNCDCLTGECVAFVSHSSRGVLYSYTGNCRAELPITAQNYTGFLKNYYEALAGVIPSTISGAGGGPAGAIAGAAGGALSVAETVLLENKPTFQRSGSCAGSAGMVGVQTPFVIIERPRYSVPNKVQKFVGQTSNITMYLGDCKGFTAVEFVHLDGLNATADEIVEIETMLSKGVIL